jgi:hypothetical protein
MLRGLSDMMPNFGSRLTNMAKTPSGFNALDTGEIITMVFRVPFASELHGPDTEDILHATTDAAERWTHPQNAPDDVPVYKLPAHARNLEGLEELCTTLTAAQGVDATVHTAYPKGISGPQVVTVSLVGLADNVLTARSEILQDTNIYLVRTRVFGEEQRSPRRRTAR